MRQPGERTEVDALIPTVCVGVANSLATVTDRVLSRALDAAPTCTTGRPGDREDLLGGIRRILDLLLQCVAEDRALDVAELSSLALFGGQRARLGMARSALPPLLDVVREQMLDALHLETARLDTDPEVAVRVARTTARRVDELAGRLHEAVLTAYDLAAPESATPHAAEEAALVDRILGRRVLDDESTRGDAERLGRRLGPWVGQVLLLGHEHDDHTSLRARADRFPHPAQRTVVGPSTWMPTLHVPLLVSCSGPADWTALLPTVEAWLAEVDAVAVSVPPSTGLRDVADAYVQVQRRLRWAAAAATTTEARLVDSRRLHLLDIVGASPADESDRFVDSVLGPLLDRPDAEDLLELLEATYRCEGGTVDVARLVHRHRNTVRKQAARIEALLGLSLDRPADRHLVDTALAIRRLRRTHHEPSPSVPRPR